MPVVNVNEHIRKEHRVGQQFQCDECRKCLLSKEGMFKDVFIIHNHGFPRIFEH